MKFPGISELYSVFRQFPKVVVDSRQAVPSSIFFGLKGDNFDGNQFAETALQRGCRYAVIDDEKQYKGENYLLVNNALTALQELAAYHRERLKIPFLAITGSNGKTTTKELIRTVLAQKYNVVATSGNLNNHIGVPLTLLSVGPDTEIAVIEMGANHLGEIAMLCEMAKPDYGLITNIGRAHIGEFGSFEAIVKAKTELYAWIKKSNGKIFIHADNPLLMENAAGLEKITYGMAEKYFCSARLAASDPFLKIRYADHAVSSHLVGKYNFENVCAAICVGKYFQIETEKILKAVEGYVPSNNRSQVLRKNENTLILDAYNANPSSTRAAIENFSEMDGRSKWLILGDMLELGKYELDEHKAILKLIAEKNFQNVILIGERFSRAASESNVSFPRFFLFASSEELSEKLKTESLIREPSLILLKGSRGMKLEKVAEYL